METRFSSWMQINKFSVGKRPWHRKPLGKLTMMYFYSL